MNRVLRSYCCIFLTLVCSAAFTQQLPITNYSSKEGNSPVGSARVFQDKQGWIWFINGYEVFRYDGQRYKSFPPAAGVTLTYVFGLMEVGNEIWVLGETGVRKISGDSIVQVSVNHSQEKFQAILQHKNNTYLLAERGLYSYSDHNVNLIVRTGGPKAQNHAGLIPYNDSLLLSYGFFDKFFVFNINSKTFYSSDMPVTDMLQDEKGKIIVLTEGNQFHTLSNIVFKDGTFQPVLTSFYKLADKTSKLSRFIIDHSGYIWAIEPLKRLIRISPDLKLYSYTEAQGLPGLVFHDMMIDREDNLWIGYTGGAYKINTRLWQRITKSEGLLLNQITFMSKDRVNIFLGSQEGTHIYQEGNISILKSHGKPLVCDYLISTENKLWYYKDVSLYSGKLDSDNTTIADEKKLANLPYRIADIKTDSNGTLIIGTVGGLYAWYKEKIINLISDSVHFRKIVIARNNELWLGQFSGPVDHYSLLYNNGELRAQKIESVVADKTMPPIGTIRALEEDRYGNIVIGTRYNGLFYATIKNNRVSSVEYFSGKAGSIGKNIWGIASGIDNKLWISTAKGINSIRLTDTGWRVTDEGKPREIFGTAGILYDDIRNWVWVMNHPGVLYFDAKNDLQSYPFKTFISVKEPGSTRFSEEAGGGSYSYNNNNFNFELSANTYLSEKSILYAYRLIKNGDEEWSMPTANPNLNLFSLNPGKYELRVKAVNANNQWSSNEAVYGFTIMPPFYQRIWFIGLMVVLLFLGLYFFYRYRIRRVKEMFEMRQAIASDLHDEIGSSLTSIHILSKMSQVNVASDQQKAHSLLEKVIDQSSQIQQNMSDIVWAIRPDNDKLEDMVTRMREYLSHSLEPKNINIIFKAEERIMSESLPMEQRRDLLLIFKEAINNIAKYSQCQMTNIRLDKQNGNIRLLIEDDGIGFDLNPNSTSNGLRNMHRRAELMKGAIRIDSTVGKGTRIELLVPIT